jgi:hypothetical protein
MLTDLTCEGRGGLLCVHTHWGRRGRAQCGQIGKLT